MKDDDCGCDVGALSYADRSDDYEELDLVLDEDPEVGAVLVVDEWDDDDELGALEVYGEEGVMVDGWKDALGALEVVDGELVDANGDPLDLDTLGWVMTALAAGQAAWDIGKGVYKAATKPSRKKARRAQQQARSASGEADKLRAELRKREAREKRNRERNAKIREINRQRRREQAQQDEKAALQKQLADLKQQQALVRREAAAREKELKKAQEAKSRKLWIGGGVAAAGLLAAYTLTRRPAEEEEGKR